MVRNLWNDELLASSWFSSEVGLKQGVKTDSHHFKAIGLLVEALELFFQTAPSGEVQQRLTSEIYLTQVEITLPSHKCEE